MNRDARVMLNHVRQVQRRAQIARQEAANRRLVDVQEIGQGAL